MTEPAFRKLTEAEYLRLLETSDTRYEFIDGFVYAQAGATNNHNIIAGNINFALYAAARQKGCQVYQSDMRLRVVNPVTGQLTNYFPDLMVSCEPATHDGGAMYLTAPCLLVEILSKSTSRSDKSEKRLDYQAIPSLQAYLLVDSLSRSAAIYRRLPDGWEYQEIEESITLACPEVTLTLTDIYEGVTL